MWLGMSYQLRLSAWHRGDQWWWWARKRCKWGFLTAPGQWQGTEGALLAHPCPAAQGSFKELFLWGHPLTCQKAAPRTAGIWGFLQSSFKVWGSTMKAVLIPFCSPTFSDYTQFSLAIRFLEATLKSWISFSGMEPKASEILNNPCTTELYFQP